MKLFLFLSTTIVATSRAFLFESSSLLMMPHPVSPQGGSAVHQYSHQYLQTSSTRDIHTALGYATADSSSSLLDENEKHQSSISSNGGTSNSSGNSSRVAPPFPNGPCGGTVIKLPSPPPPTTTTTSPSSLQPQPSVSSSLLNNAIFGEIILQPKEIVVWLPPDYQIDYQEEEQQEQQQEQQQRSVLYVHDGVSFSILYYYFFKIKVVLYIPWHGQ